MYVFGLVFGTQRFALVATQQSAVVFIVFKVELFCEVVKPMFEICFGGSYVNFLFIVELVRRHLCFIDDVWIQHGTI